MSQSRRPVIAGNWKMNCLRDDGLALAKAIAECSTNLDCALVICPPATLLYKINCGIEGTALGLGAQDCHWESSGAYTGDLSPEMLKDAGCSYVIVGHSERREGHKETDSDVQAKAEAAQKAGLTAIICVGETEAQRDSGETMDVISSQIAGSVPVSADASNTIIAYEPVWAIGTGRTASPEEAQEVHLHIRKELAGGKLGEEEASALRILYGGSMKPANATELLAQYDIDGGLIGGASLKAPDFLAIAEAASK